MYQNGLFIMFFYKWKSTKTYCLNNISTQIYISKQIQYIEIGSNQFLIVNHNKTVIV